MLPEKASKKSHNTSAVKDVKRSVQADRLEIFNDRRRGVDHGLLLRRGRQSTKHRGEEPGGGDGRAHVQLGLEKAVTHVLVPFEKVAGVLAGAFTTVSVKLLERTATASLRQGKTDAFSIFCPY